MSVKGMAGQGGGHAEGQSWITACHCWDRMSVDTETLSGARGLPSHTTRQKQWDRKAKFQGTCPRKHFSEMTYLKQDFPISCQVKVSSESQSRKWQVRKGLQKKWGYNNV